MRKKVTLTIEGIFDYEEAGWMKREHTYGVPHIDRPAIEKEIMQTFQNYASDPKINTVAVEDAE